MLAHNALRSAVSARAGSQAIVNLLRPSTVRRMTAVVPLAASRDVVAGQTKLYVGNLSWDTNKDDLYDLFNKYGSVSDVFLPTDRESGRPRGFGFVTLDAAAADSAVQEVNGIEFMGRDIRVNPAQDAAAAPRSFERAERSFSDRPPRAPRPPLDPSQKKLYVGNLAWETSKDDLIELFSAKFGTVFDVNVPIDRETERPRGFAFVTISAEYAEDAVAEFDGFEFMNRTLRVNEAQDSPEGGRGGGGGFRGGRGGGGGRGGFRGGRGGGGGGFRGGREEY